jgi:adenine-specific DNA methylase
LRNSLLDFIADFANWDNSTQPDYLETSRALTQAAHEALGGVPGTRPLVVDPFAGGGSIPLEALRVGADAFASDLNPVAVLLNKVVLEYIPKYGKKLADEVRKWGQWVKEEAEKELAEFYPKDADGSTPIAYLWARTIVCEGPVCGAEVPLMRSLWLAKKSNRSIALRIIPKSQDKQVDFEIIEKQKGKWVVADRPEIEIKNPSLDGTVKRGSATCPCCGFTTPVASVKIQFKARRGGADDARLFCVVTTRDSEKGRFYRLPNEKDIEAVRRAGEELEKRKRAYRGELSLVPDEALDVRGIRHTWAMIYGLERWGDLFTLRQALALTKLVRLVKDVGEKLADGEEQGLAIAVQTCLAFAVDKIADLGNSLNRWEPVAQCPRQLFGRQAIPMVWDFSEGVPIGVSSGSFEIMYERFVHVLNQIGTNWNAGQTQQANAATHPLPDDFAQYFCSDPPYYDAVPYAYLSDFFYVWLRRTLEKSYRGLLSNEQVPKEEEIVVDRPHELSNSKKDITFYERELTKAFGEGCRILQPDGIGTIVFASKTTASWEAILKAVIDARWTITGSWPIDTEMENRVAAQGQARLASSVHLVCRPRNTNEIGDWRDVLQELPQRIHDWMPRLASEGVVGADAIFACLGPALEIFSRYDSVEKASGEIVTLKEYLEYVWAAVSKEALSNIFKDADTSSFEEDARLTAMWLWTLSSGDGETGKMPVPQGDGKTGKMPVPQEEEDVSDDDDESTGKKAKITGFSLEYDAARKIAQGLGANLDNLASLVQVKGDQARLLPVSERSPYLFGKDAGQAPVKRPKKEHKQLSLFDTSESTADEVSEDWGDTNIENQGKTVLDRIHQTMILFAAGRSEALKRFLVDDGVGSDKRFWTLAQSLSALYPAGTDEKRWVDGVLARKKGLGF